MTNSQEPPSEHPENREQIGELNPTEESHRQAVSAKGEPSIVVQPGDHAFHPR